MKPKSLPPVILLIIFTACIPNKQVLYLQNKPSEPNIYFDSLIKVQYPEYKLQVGDILNIDVKSSDPTITSIFRNSSTMNIGNVSQGGADVNYLNGFPILNNGYLELPLVGSIFLAGMTTIESKNIIQKEIQKYITDAFVSVRLGGIRYTALGEFKRPGRYSILQSQLTIFEAIANAGDLSILADRQHAIIIRQYTDGARVHQVDLTDSSLMTSEFYYVKPNDQLYLQPLPVRQYGGNLGVTAFQTLTGVLSAVSSALLIIVSLNRL